jgi:SAM-dependent methyltransferase
LDALEISGNAWHSSAWPFRSYTSANWPDYDVCTGPLRREAFDLVLAEQVFEHLLWPYRAARNVHAMLRPGGHFLLSTPFLIKIHLHPEDCSRWTETGLRYLLAEAGFELGDIQTGSWGNRACVDANFTRWESFNPNLHSLKNDPEFPIVVWALARKAAER